MGSREGDLLRRGYGRSRSRSPSFIRTRLRSFSPVAGRAGRYRHRAEDEDGNPHYSNYYRDRFGSESPQEYQNLRITNINPKVTNDELRDTLERYLSRYGDMNVKVVRQMDPNERIAYVNFERTGDARDARHGCLHKLVSALGRRVTVDPAGVLRDQEGKHVKPSVPGAGPQRSPPPPPPPQYDRYRERDRYFRDYDRPRDYDRGYRNDRRY